AERLINAIGIPSQPGIVLDINREVSRMCPDMGLISELVEKDVSMSAKVIKIANSPFFSIRKSNSIAEALLTIGATNFSNIIVSASLRESVDRYGGNNGNRRLTEKFWRHSSFVAVASRFIAKKIRSPLIEMAYMAGLFHDCSIPLFLKRYPDYAELMDQALWPVPIEALQGACKSIIGIEDERYSTNHCIAGYMIAKAWLLPEKICEAICHHHYIDITIHKDPVVEQLVAILLLAEYLIQKNEIATSPSGYSHQWAELHQKPLEILGVQSDDFADIEEDLSDILSEGVDL
ncbi:MAG: HDOD domain-containing protein, partial [Nitrospiraceae bacterium]|nr:HDOD domain-containing protein [Nitrospiraceae bacterium]